MANEKLISFDLKADFAFFRKPDYNAGIQLSYNMIHKPAILGLLGAIIGLEGYNEKGQLPEYYKKLRQCQVGVTPLNHQHGNYPKTILRYVNGVGYANKDGNLLVDETMLIAPAYRCFALLDIDSEIERNLYHHILNNEAEFIPYLGKNEFQAWIENPTEHNFSQVKAFDKSFAIDSLFLKSGIIKNQVVEPEINFDFSVSGGSFTYFERLPIGFNEELMQYKMADFAFTDWKMKQETIIPNLYSIETEKGNCINIQLF